MLQRFIGKRLDRLVIDQAVGQAALGIAVEAIDAALVNGAFCGKEQRESGIEKKGDANDEGKPAAVPGPHDRQHQTDFNQGGHQCKQAYAEQKRDPVGAAFDIGQQPADASLRMESRAQCMQVAEYVERIGCNGILGDARKQQIAQFIEQRA